MRYWYGLDDCVLRCTPAKPGRAMRTMVELPMPSSCCTMRKWKKPKNRHPFRRLRLQIPDSVTEIGEDAFLDVPHIIYNGPAQSKDNWGALSRN